MASNTTQVPVEVKLQISNQAQVMRKLTNEFQDVFSNVDPGTAFGKKLAKAFSKIDNKLISAESLLGKDFFSESDMLRVTKYIESISEAMGEINTRAQSMSAKGLGLDTTEIEKAHQAVIDLQKTITEQKKAKVGSILAVDSKDFQELSALSSKSGFSGGKNFANNISAMNVSVGKLRQEWAELTNAAKEAEQAQQNALKTKVQANLKVNAAQAELDKRANFNEDVAQQIAAVRLGGTKGRGIQQVISDYQQLLTEQLEGTDWKTGGFDFAQVIAGWLEVDPSELEGAATEVVQKLQFAIQEKLQKDALKKSNLLRSNAEAILSGQKDILSKDSGYTYRNQQAMEASIELQNASTAFDEANQNFLNIQTNAKNCEELLDKITAQIERLKELQKQYNDLVDEQNKEELDNARQREQQARRMAEEPTKEESQNIYRQTSENVKKTQQISAENIERNRIQKQHEMEQEALERETEQFTSNLKQSIRQWMSAQQVINLIKQGIRQAYQDIQGLDKAMTNIAVVTDMSVSDLWGKINDYMSIAQQYGVTTQGVYEVSQLYYQQGLGTDEVMAATTETLKMARIAGMEYAEAADAMTVAIRAFKMEMSEAAHVTDVYSKVAAVTASDTEELAIAMSKTASSAESVGSSFENTTAMLAVMIETTRESAQNLGSALKSIISRYGEMKTGLTVDSEGELIDYNKVDTALKSVGISLKDTQGQFRDFDEVIFELSSKWDTLDKNTQRYIATVMAGNRQQSRFIALVDNWERLDEVAKSAEDSEDAGLLQYSKTLDSLETKINNIKTSFQQFYMDIFNGPLIGKGLEFINNIIKGFNKLGKLSSILNISSIVGAVKVISTVFVSNFANSFKQISNAWKGTLREMSVETGKSAKEQGLKWYQGFTEKNNQGKTVLSKKGGKVATGAMMAGSILSMVGSSVASKNQTAGAWLSAGGNALSIGAQLAMINPVLGLVGGGIAGFVTLLTSLPSKMEKAQQELEKATEKSNEANIKRAETKDKYNNLNEYLTKLENLERTRYDSQENYDEWVKVNSQTLEAFPELASTFDEANNAVVDLIAAEDNLTQARINAQNAAKDAADAQIATALANQKTKEKEFLDAEQNRLNFTDNTSYLIVDTQNNSTATKKIDSRFIGSEGLFGWQGTAFSEEEINKASSQKDQKDLVMPKKYTTTNLSQERQELLLAQGHIMYFGQEKEGKDYNLIVMNDELGDASDLLDLKGDNREQIFNWLLTLNTTDPNKYAQNLALGFQPEFLKKGKTEEDFIKAATGGIYTSKQELLQLSQLERDAKLSQKATENTVRAGIGTYLTSDFMWEDQDESFTGLANVNKVFQEALYKDFETFLDGGKITEESWEKWVDNNYNDVYAKLQKDYKNFYKTLSSYGQIEDYNAFEQGSATLTGKEYEERLREFGVDFKVEEGDPNLLGDELVDQFIEQYEDAKENFYEAIDTIDFLGIEAIFDEATGEFKGITGDDASIFGNFQFRQEYSDEIMTQARQLEKYVEAGQMTTEQAKEYFTNYINLWETLEVNKDQLKPDQLEQIRTILSQTDFTTPEGIVESFRQIGEIYTEAGLEIPENFSLDANNILNYINSSLVNLNTSYNTLANKVAENIDLISKQIDKASNGFDNIKDLTEFGDKYGLTADDFTFDALTGKWKASESVYNAILEKEKLNITDQQNAIDEALNQQKEALKEFGLDFNASEYGTYKQFKEAQLADKESIEGYEKVNTILERNWDNYITAWTENNNLTFYEYLENYAQEQLTALQKDAKELSDYFDYITNRRAAIDKAETGNLDALKRKNKIESQKILSQNYSALTEGQLAAIKEDLGIDLEQWVKDNKDGTFDVSSFIGSDTFINLPIETQNTILSSIEAEFNAASEAISNLGAAAAGKADPGVYAKAFDKIGRSYEFIEEKIPEWIRRAAIDPDDGDAKSKLLYNIRKQIKAEGFTGTQAELAAEADRRYQEIISGYKDATKSNTLTALDAMGKALDGTLEEQEFLELQDLEFSADIDISWITTNLTTNLEENGTKYINNYWAAISEAINKIPEEQWESYFDDAAERSFKEAFKEKESSKLNKEVSEASGEFSEELITDVARQAKKILDPNVLSQLFNYEVTTDTYSAKLGDKTREQWITEVAQLGFSEEALRKSFKGQDYNKIIKTDTIQESLNNLLAASSEITLDSIKSLYDEIYGEGAFTSDQDFDLINTWIDQAKEGSYNNIISYIQSLYEAAISQGYDIDTSEIQTLIQQFYENIIETLSSALSAGIEGSLDTATFNDLAKKYGISGTKTATGYSLGESAQRTLVSEMYKAAELSGSTMGFGEQLWKTWSESANAPLKSYAAISDELDKAINKTGDLVDATDEYVKALEQARAAAYLDPNAYEFSFMEQDATSGLTQNFDNFVSQIDTIKSVFESFDSGEAVGYKDFYNMMDFIGNSEIGFSKFSELTGIAKEDYESFVNSVVENTDEWGKVDIGSVAAELGISVDAAMTAMSEGMEDGLKEVADQQVKYLEGLENMLLAMQALSGLNVEAGIEFDIVYNENGQNITFTSFEEILDHYQQLPKEKKSDFLVNIKQSIENLPGNAGELVKIFGGDEDISEEDLIIMSKIESAWDGAAKETREKIIASLQDLTQEQGQWLAEYFASGETTDIDISKLFNFLIEPETIGQSFGSQLQNAFSKNHQFNIANNPISVVLDSLDGTDFKLDGNLKNLGPGRIELEKQLNEQLAKEGLEINEIDYETGLVTVKKLNIPIDEIQEVAVKDENENGEVSYKVPISGDIELVWEKGTSFTLENVEGLSSEEIQKQIAEYFHVALESVQLTEIEGEVGQFNVDIDFSTQKDSLTLIQEDLAAIREAFETGIELTIDNEQALSAVDDIKSAIDDLPDTHTIFITTIKKTIDNTRKRPNNYVAQGLDGEGQWTGNMNNITGSALADGNVTDKLLAGANLANKTLVGELGPELAVYNGKYHMLGANGAEFVKLPSDAIVFNHLQTAGILKGQMNVRGQALAEGNVSGPALAGGGSGIDSALDAVRRAKAVWQGLLDNLTAAELAGAAGGGGGGGGGAKNHSEELQEWYNLSRQISNIEQEINNILAERKNITEGDSYLRSLREQQKLLREQANIQEVLLGYQQLQLKRQADTINNDKLWSRFLEVDESGLLQYTKGNELNGGKGALQVLQEMNEMSGEDQIKFLKEIGYTYTTADGEELKEGELVQKFYEELQKQIDDYDALYDTVHETKETLEGIDTSISEIDEEIKQNQMDLEQAIFDIIVEAWEKQIEQMEEYNDLVKEANDRYIDGLNDALEKEKELYSQNETIAEREQLQRRLSLLRRSGGSASEIASLEEQLDDKLKDEYFRNQEEAIKNIQEANDRQVELLEQQVKLQQDNLEYQKEHGVIWSQVSDIMSGSAEEILNFMQGNKPEFFTQSLLQQEEMLTKWAKEIGIYTEDRQYQNHEAYARGSIWDNGNIFNNDKLKSLQGAFNNLTPEQQQQLQELFSSTYATSRINGADEETATNEAINALAGKMGDHSEQQGLASGSSGNNNNNGNGNNNSKNKQKWKFFANGKWHEGFVSISHAEKGIEKLSLPAQIPETEKKKIREIALSTITPYSKGGLVDYTGLAMVHGSKSKPESFLNAEQTAQIREALEISGNRNMLEDVRSSLQALQSTIKSITNIANNSETSSITIAPGAVVIEVAELADSYDVDTLSADVMNRIVNIANKRTTRSVNRR